MSRDQTLRSFKNSQYALSHGYKNAPGTVLPTSCRLVKANIFRVAVPKYRVAVCKMKKSKIPKLCQDIGLGKLFLKKNNFQFE